ncbi:3031_t:CDS:2, partial [Acaulospora colombiana]
TEAEEVLYKALETVASENNAKARKLLVNFNELINSTSVKTYWNGVYVRDERNKTQCIKNILKEKEDQEACQIKSNVLVEHIIESNLLLKRKRSFEKLDREPPQSPENQISPPNNLVQQFCVPIETKDHSETDIDSNKESDKRKQSSDDESD